MPKTYYDSELTAEQIEDALTAVDGVVNPSNNGKVLYIENGKIKAASASRWSSGAVLESLSVTANGDYTPPTGTDGFDSVHVAIPGATLITKSITQNGTYNASQDNADGYSSVTVDVQGGGSAVVEPLSVTQNGIYTPPSGVDGYAPVTVNVSGGGIDRSKQNSSMAGNCYIKEGKITGFTNATSIWQPKDASNSDLVVDWSQPFEIHTRFTLNNTYNGGQALFGANASGIYFVLPTCEIRTTEFWFGFTTNGSSWTDSIGISSVPILANSEYEISVVYDGTKITVTVSDGTNEQVSEITPSTSLYNNNTYKIGFGGIAKNSNLVARYVAFDPDDTYIKSNGSIVWGAKS